MSVMPVLSKYLTPFSKSIVRPSMKSATTQVCRQVNFIQRSGQIQKIKTFRSELYHTQTYSTPCGSTIVLKKFQPVLLAYRSPAQAIHMIQQPSPDAVGVKKNQVKEEERKGIELCMEKRKRNKNEIKVRKKQTFVWKNHQGPVSHSPYPQPSSMSVQS